MACCLLGLSRRKKWIKRLDRAFDSLGIRTTFDGSFRNVTLLEPHHLQPYDRDQRANASHPEDDMQTDFANFVPAADKKPVSVSCRNTFDATSMFFKRTRAFFQLEPLPYRFFALHMLRVPRSTKEAGGPSGLIV